MVNSALDLAQKYAKKIVDQFANATAIAVPAFAVERHIGEAKRWERTDVRRAVVLAETFEIDAYVLSAPSPKKLMNAVRRLETLTGHKFSLGMCLWKTSPVPLLLVGEADVHIRDDGTAEEIESRDANRKEFLAIAERALRPSLERLSRYAGGVSIVFHHGGGMIRDPFDDVPGVVRFFDCAGPPGEFKTQYVSMAFDVPLDIGLAALSRKPSRGRGVVFKDKETELVQVLGSNLYLLIPTFSRFVTESTPAIFGKLLALAWNGARQARSRKVRPPRSVGRATFVKETGAWSASYKDKLAADLKAQENLVRRLQEELAAAHAKIRELRAVEQAYDSSPLIAETLARLPDDHKRITSMPGVRAIEIVDGGLHVRTGEIVAEHGGDRYRLGEYVIRTGSGGRVTVWAERTFHPGGVPHPHIGKDGVQCLGNATEVIAKHGAYHRYADVVLLVLRWLERGYTPELASVKIEEWPKVAAADGLPRVEHVAPDREFDKAAPTDAKEHAHG